MLYTPKNDFFITCVALAKAGIVVGPLRPSVRLSVCSFIHPSVRSFVHPSVCPQHFWGA